MRRLGSMVLCCFVGMLAAAAPASAAVFNNVKGKAEGCFFASNGQYVNVGLTTDVDTGPIFDTPQPWPEYVSFETTIKLRELYGTSWKRLLPRVARTPQYDLSGSGVPYNRSFFRGSRLYSNKAYRKLRKLTGTAQVRVKDAETGEVLAESPVVRFSWKKKNSRSCQLGPPPVQLPVK